MQNILFHSCGGGCNGACRADSAEAVEKRDKTYPTIDFHCHVFVPAIEDIVKDHPQKQAEMQALNRSMGEVSAAHNANVMLPDAGPRLVNMAQRLIDMDAMGVDIQVISPSPVQYCYWADEELANTLVQTQNEAIAALCQQYPERIMGLGTVALQFPKLAVEQLKNCMEMGLKGVEISTQIADKELSDPIFDPFWQVAQDLGSVVFIHPFGADFGKRLEAHYLSNIIGQPLETTIALSHMIFSGVLERFPHLKILAAHGGGYLPTYIQRSDHGYQVRPECQNIAKPPSDYLRNIWFDSLVYDDLALFRLIDQVGISQVVVGSDYPFDMGAYDIHARLSAMPLSEYERKKILSDNALTLLGISR